METPALVRNGVEFAQGDDDVEAFVENTWQRGKIMQIDMEKNRMELWVSSWYRWFDLNSDEIRKFTDSTADPNRMDGSTAAISTPISCPSKKSYANSTTSSARRPRQVSSIERQSILRNSSDSANAENKVPITRMTRQRIKSALSVTDHTNDVIVCDDVKPAAMNSSQTSKLDQIPCTKNTSISSAVTPLKVRRSRTERIVFARFKGEAYFYPGVVRINRDDLKMYQAYRREKYQQSANQQVDPTSNEAHPSSSSTIDAANVLDKTVEQNAEKGDSNTATSLIATMSTDLNLNATVDVVPRATRKSKRSVANANIEVHYFDGESEFVPLVNILILEDRQPLPAGTQMQVQANGKFVPDTMRGRNVLRCLEFGVYCEAQIESVSSEIQRTESAPKAPVTIDSNPNKHNREFLYKVRLGRGIVEEDVPVWRMRLTIEQQASLCASTLPTDIHESDFDEVDTVDGICPQKQLDDAEIIADSSADESTSLSLGTSKKHSFINVESEQIGETDSVINCSEGTMMTIRRSARVAMKHKPNYNNSVARSRAGARKSEGVPSAQGDEPVVEIDDDTVPSSGSRRSRNSSTSTGDRFTKRPFIETSTQAKIKTTRKSTGPKKSAPVKSKRQRSNDADSSKSLSDLIDETVHKSLMENTTIVPPSHFTKATDSFIGGPLGEGIFSGRSFVLLRATLSVGAQQSVAAVDADRVALTLRRNGGSVRSGFFETPTDEPQSSASGSSIPNIPRECYLLAVQHSRVPLYLEAIALGVPCVSYVWVEECVKTLRLLDYRMYLLQTGVNILTESVIMREPRCTPIFANRRFYVIGFTPTFALKWWPVITAAAGDYLRAPALPPTLTSQQLVAAAEDPSSKLIEEVKATLIASCGTVASLIQARQVSCDFVLLQTRDECRMESTVVHNLFAEAIRIVNNQLRLSAPEKLITTDFVSQCILQGRLLERSSYGRFIPL